MAYVFVPSRVIDSISAGARKPLDECAQSCEGLQLDFSEGAPIPDVLWNIIGDSGLDLTKPVDVTHDPQKQGYWLMGR